MKTIGLLVGCDNWPDWDYAQVEQQEFEISAVVWAVVVGPAELIIGLEHGKTRVEVLLAAEQAWIEQWIDTLEYEDKKAALGGLADRLCGWAMGVLEDEKERNGEGTKVVDIKRETKSIAREDAKGNSEDTKKNWVAKASKVKKVGIKIAMTHGDIYHR